MEVLLLVLLVDQELNEIEGNKYLCMETTIHFAH